MKQFFLTTLFLFSIVSAFARQETDTVRMAPAVAVGHLVDRQTIPVQTLAGEELRRLNAVSVADAIRYFSGVQVKDYGGIGGLKTVNIRSLGSQHTGVFYDGIALGNAQNGQIDLGRFSMDNLEAISLYNGQKSAVLQSAKDFASAGAVYLLSRRPTFEAGRSDNLRLSLKGGSFGTVNPSALWERRLNGKLDAQIGAEFLSTTGKYRFTYAKTNGYDTTAVRRNGDVRALRVEGGLFGRLPRGDWRARAYLYDSERGYPGASVREVPGMFRNEDRQWDRNLFVQSSLRQFLGRYNLLVQAKYAHDYLRYRSDPRRDASTMYADDRYRQQEGYFSLAQQVTVGKYYRFGLSADVLYNTLDADKSGFASPRRLTVLAAGAAEADFERWKVQASVLHTRLHDKVGSRSSERGEWSPSLVVSYRPFEDKGLSLRAFYKRIFRMPTFNDLYYTTVGVKYLRPEFTTQYDVGAVWERDFPGGLLRRIEVQADAYFNRVTDKIIAMPTANQFRWTMLNLGYVEIRGLDAAVQGVGRAGKVEFRARLSYTYQKAQDFTDPRESYHGSQIPYIPRHSGSVVAGAAWREWELNYSFIYTGQRWEQSDNIPENYAQPWYTHDLSLSRTIGRWRFTTEVNNVFDQAYEVVQGYPMPGANVRLKAEWEM